MAFGFSSNYSQKFPLDGLTPEQFYSITLKAIEKLDWKLGKKNEKELVVISKNRETSNELLLSINTDEVEICYDHGKKPILSWSKGKESVLLLLETLHEFKSNVFKEELPVSENIPNVHDTLQSDEDNTELKRSPKEKVKDFFAIFKPTENYFITPILINLNIIVFILMLLSGAHIINPDTTVLLQWGANFRPQTLEGEYWRLITCCFLHIGIIHLIMNMYALLYIGAILEPYLGRTKFLVAYLITGLLASVASIWWHDLTVSAGASGAIFGMYGVFIALLSTSVIDKETRQALLPSILFFTGYNLLFGMQGNIDNAAHIGGLLSGIAVGYIFIYSLKNSDSKNVKYIAIGSASVASIIVACLICKTIPNDIAVYDKKMQDFTLMEDKALSFYKLPENTTSEKQLSHLKDTGLFYWNKNKALLAELDQLELPEFVHIRNAKLINYCTLRIKCYELMCKSIQENSNNYDTLIIGYNNEIQTLVNSIQ